MNNEQIVAVFAALIIGMIVALVWTYRSYRKKQKPKEQRDDVTLHVRLGAKPEQVEPTHEELLQTRVEQLSKQLEQETARANNNEAIAENYKIAKVHVMDELDDAFTTIQTLREALDRAFKVIAQQNEQIKQLGNLQLGEGWDEQQQPSEQPEAVEFKVGDYVRGERVFKKGEEVEGVMLCFCMNGDIRVKTSNGHKWVLYRSTCRHVPRPEQQQQQPAEPAIDWSRPVAFPDKYEIPKGVGVVKVGEDDSWVKKGSVGKTNEFGNNPSIDWESEDYDLDGSGLDWTQPSDSLAPLDPRDHPLHPEFYGKGWENA